MTDLNEYRQRRAAAKAYHPSQWTPIAWRDDAIATAQAFHANLDNAERGVALDEAAPQRALHRSRWSSHLFGQSRFRRAKIYDGLAVALLMALAALMGCIIVLLSAPKANADTGTRAFAWQYGPEICSYLDEHPTIAGVVAAGKTIIREGYTAEESGEVIAYSVFDVCQRHMPLLRQFIMVYGPKQVA